jgi:gliding motility-associated-like protein
MQAATQLCSGSLGDPTVHISFGSGNNPGAPLNTGITNYNYVGTDCPNDGFYAIRNNTSNCYSAWHSLSGDHTGDPNGHFMLVNASYQAGDFYQTTVSGLCANTTYEFAAWIMNMIRVDNNSIKPNLTFSIEKTDGTVLQFINTGEIDWSTVPQWKQYGFYFTTAPGVHTVVLRISNNAPGGIGNDLALDDITFRPCGPQLNITSPSSSDTIEFCENNSSSFLLQGTVASGYADPRYQWQYSADGINWTDIAGADALDFQRDPTGAGDYYYRLSVAESENFHLSSCRIASNKILFRVHPLPIADAGTDQFLIKGESVTLQAVSSVTNAAFEWSPPDHLSHPEGAVTEASPPADQTYSLTVTTPFGCSATDAVFVRVVNDIYIPTAFTPDGDGNNDHWRIPYLDPARGADVKVFNRYGQLVYHTSGSVNWDGNYKGKQQPSGVYVFLVDFKKGRPMRKGTIMLIR